MIGVTIHINGTAIFARTAVNQQRSQGEYTVYKCDDGSVILHKRGDGAVVLAKKLLDTIKEQE